MTNHPGKYDPFFFWVSVLFLGLGIIWLLPWRFQTNDDVMMMWLVSGAYTGEPESYAVFIHPWLSWMFSRLYSLSPEINWYGLTWFGVNFLSAFLLLEKIWTSNFPTIQKHFWSLFIALISFHFAFFPQFTLIAGWAGLAGIFVIFDASLMNKWIRFLGYLVFFLGVSIRFESAVLIVLGATWAAFVFPEIRVGFSFFRGLSILSLAILLWVGKRGYEQATASEEYLTFNRARAKVLDHPVFVQQSQNGSISNSSDWFLVSRWMFEDLSLDSEDFLLKKKELDQGLFTSEAINDGFSRIFRVQQTELFKSMLILVLVGSFLVGLGNAWKKLLFLGAWLTFYLIFNHFNLLLGRVNLLFFLVLLFPVFQLPSRPLTKGWVFSQMSILSLFLAIHSFNFWQEAKGRQLVQKEFYQLLEETKPDIPISMEGVMEYLFLDSFSKNRPVPFLSYGWISRSPMQEKAYQFRGFSRQKEWKEYALVAFQFPEPLVFPQYMNRISPGFILQEERKTESLILFRFSKEK